MKEIDDHLSEECKRVADELTKVLNEKGANSGHLEILCVQNPQCETNLREIFDTWNKLDGMDVPNESHDRRNRFYRMLVDFEQEVTTEKPNSHFIRRSFMYPLMKWAAVLLIGVFVGVMVTTYSYEAKNGGFASEDQTILTPLTSKSSFERLTALQTIKMIDYPENQVFDALFETLTNDPNVNVRLSTIEAFLHFSDQPRARTMLIKALTFQDSPIVQLTLAEVIIKLQEEGALEELRKVLKTNRFHKEVKTHLEETLNL